MVLQLAQERGRAEAYTEAMFKAFFQQDRDIGADEVITDVATSVGLDHAEACIAHVAARGLPFVGVLVDATGKMISEVGVNRATETGDPTAHAEVVAMRDAMTTHGLDTLTGTVLLATGEPCGLSRYLRTTITARNAPARPYTETGETPS
ncbi:DsbA family protein [Nonomuraea sp. CA-218870]|uniref:DsbA family protein n=1 Tax=Nonomuraea sp. CA-218870 TaxID=3239998 RepID=UPI003D8CEEE4